MSNQTGSSHSRTSGVVVLVMCAAAAALVGCGEPPAPKLRYADRLARVRKVAVVPFVDAPGKAAEGSGKIVVNAIIAELFQCPGVQVIERTRIKTLIDERAFQKAQLTDPGVASKIGRLAGADLVFLGEVTQYEAQQEYGHAAISVLSGGGTKHMHRVGLSVRAVDVNNGQIVYAKLGQGENRKGYTHAAGAAAKEVFGPLQAFYRALDRARNEPKK